MRRAAGRPGQRVIGATRHAGVQNWSQKLLLQTVTCRGRPSADTALFNRRVWKSACGKGPQEATACSSILRDLGMPWMPTYAMRPLCRLVQGAVVVDPAPARRDQCRNCWGEILPLLATSKHRVTAICQGVTFGFRVNGERTPPACELLLRKMHDPRACTARFPTACALALAGALALRCCGL